jgi:hypothetical protein
MTQKMSPVTVFGLSFFRLHRYTVKPTNGVPAHDLFSILF